MLTTEEILLFIRSNREKLSRDFHILKIGLFGSFARGEQTEESDIDLLVEIEPGLPRLSETKEGLRDFFGRRFNRSVDIARERYLKPFARKSILRETRYVE